MCVTLTHIDNVFLDICPDYENRIFVSADVQTLALSDCIELRSIMFPDNFPEWIVLVSGFLYMFLSASVGLGPRFNLLTPRHRQFFKLLVSHHGNFFSRERRDRHRTSLFPSVMTWFCLVLGDVAGNHIQRPVIVGKD